jgi:competence protein ComEC
MGALVFTVPLSAHYFGTLVLISPLSNLFCLWAASIVFMLGLIAVALSFLWLPLGIAAAVLPRVLAGYILGVSHLLAEIPYHAVYFVNPYLKYWLAFAYLLFSVAYWMKPNRKRKYAVAAALSALTLAVAVRLGAAAYSHPMDAVILDVGQGQSIVLASGDQTVLVDCGSANSWYDAGGLAADQLLTMGHRTVDYLILTHYDSDHVNGVESLLSRMRVETILVPSGRDEHGLSDALRETARVHDVSVCAVDAVQRIPVGSAVLAVYPPAAKEGTGDNENGLLILAAVGAQELLITGDMDSAAERKTLEEYDLPDVELLIAGHHGSGYSTTTALLEETNPEVAIISAGKNNRYGHPSPKALQRLQNIGCMIYRTDLYGTVIYRR